MTRYAVLSDVHANLDALNAVLKDVRRTGAEEVLFLGDAVGYGPSPNECIDLLASTCRVLLAGNHDRGAVGLTDVAYFNTYARTAIEWTKGVLTEENKNVLRSFPVKKALGDRDVFLVHSTPKEPEEWHYLLTLWDAEINFQYFNHKCCFLGHSHEPFIIEKLPSGELVTYKDSAKIKEKCKYIINAGSVGQPRDGDARACFVTVDDGSVEIRRVAYDITGVQTKMKKEHLPDRLIERLSIGR